MEESGLYTLRRPRQFKGRADSRPRPVSMPVEAVTMLDLPDVASMSRVAEDAVTGAGVARRMAQHSGLCLSFEVTNEMKTKESCFSRSNVASVYGINFVTNSYIPRHIFKTGKKIEGLRKIRKVV